ncbi:MAG TPA: DUF4337 family protein [Pirellulales bacterium]|nr:DUF4337 family protein [Pirellulales bacterium]
MEIPIEQVHEHIHHAAHHSEEQWVGMVALSTAILAGLAAIASLLSGLNANTSIRETVKASDQWSYYQAKNVKATILQMKIDMLTSLDRPVPKGDQAEVDKEKKKMAKIQDDANELGRSADERFERHETLAPSVTWFQVAVAVSAIAVLTKRRWFWYLSLVFGAIALGYLIWGETFVYREVEGGKEEAKPKAKASAQLFPGGNSANAASIKLAVEGCRFDCLRS